jgi:peptide-methionine (S)-S-oxide reductase
LQCIKEDFDMPVGRSTSMMTIAALAVGATAFWALPSFAEKGRTIPSPMIDEPAAAAPGAEVAVLAGGCFWGIQGVFQHVDGVTSAVSGYAGGSGDAANYERVSTGTTGHAEAVRITFDPRRISYGRLLQIYFAVAHDPTELNRQGPDRGTQYRSAIFPADSEQARIAKAYIAQLDHTHVFPQPIVTQIEPGQQFFPAEVYHQDYLTQHPSQPYIAINDLPKISELKRLFPSRYRAAPVLVAAARPAG